ncbi:hypothetical protein A3A21_03135 [Candidatus Jorgensenbacteria bacterium RIFCSPLOWO2_01_FULL_45_25b]|uniref:Probable queuosine precursor transporter n=1 Tax=Candidatus Jorgensenbacteria bacterium RIFCSPLOWO2_01_FULL_45_25b TaxID=1798471 RepID=A0A1F6BVU8_9BACT|nr:MAG: hypothetical protein A3A21_03135 [Candidatus Jorgensenbacteria bacterium RIFCSPLOWO2_01_FULL_45_25b]
MIQLSQRSFLKLVIALALYLTSLFAANTLGLKLMPFVFGTHLSVAVFSFPIVFLMTDVVGEIYGKGIARMFVLAGLVSTLFFVLYSFLSLGMPWSEDASWVREGYNTVFGISARIAIASLLAFFIAEYQDVFSFFFLKARMGDKFFWLRSMISNIWSQFFDTAIFMSVAFLGVYPLKVLVGSAIAWWAYKVLMGALYSPLSYLGLYLLRERGREQTQ